MVFTVTGLLTPQLCHSISLIFPASSHRHDAHNWCSRTWLSHNSTSATEHGARCSSPGQRNSRCTPRTLSPLTESPRADQDLASFTILVSTRKVLDALTLPGAGRCVGGHTYSSVGAWEVWVLAGRTMCLTERAAAVLTLYGKVCR